MDAAYIVNVQNFVSIRNPLRKPFKPIPKANNFEPVIDRFNGDGTEHAIDAGRRTAPNQHRQPAIRYVVSHMSLRNGLSVPALRENSILCRRNADERVK